METLFSEQPDWDYMRQHGYRVFSAQVRRNMEAIGTKLPGNVNARRLFELDSYSLGFHFRNFAFALASTLAF